MMKKLSKRRRKNCVKNLVENNTNVRYLQMFNQINNSFVIREMQFMLHLFFLFNGYIRLKVARSGKVKSTVLVTYLYNIYLSSLGTSIEFSQILFEYDFKCGTVSVTIIICQTFYKEVKKCRKMKKSSKLMTNKMKPCLHQGESF